MERSLVDTFAPARNMGVMTFGHTEDEMATWQIGTFRTNSDNFGNDSFDSGQALTMRTTRLLWYDEPSEGRYYFHVGAGYSYRDTYRDGVRFRNTPEIRVDQPGSDGTFAPMFIDTGNIPASNFQLFDGELAWTQGSFSAQSEYAFASVNQIGGPQLFFDSFMVQASYFLTGEHRRYYRPTGIHERVIPNTNFMRTRDKDGCINMGPGAWEVAARYSWIRLNDQNIAGNNLYDVTLGVNWYWNAYARMKFNYIRAFLQDEATGRSATNIFGVRMDFEF
jgi:phosphate-selective porin OprO/OprP